MSGDDVTSGGRLLTFYAGPRNKDKIVYNRQTGHMLRTKLSSSNEGGVAAGMGALDSPYLID